MELKIPHTLYLRFLAHSANSHNRKNHRSRSFSEFAMCNKCTLLSFTITKTRLLPLILYDEEYSGKQNQTA